jgi:hypothetical protein
MLEYRHKCEPLRSAADELFAIVSSPDVDAIEKAEVRDKFLGSWDAMVAACGEASTAQLVFANSQAQFLRHGAQARIAASARHRRDDQSRSGGDLKVARSVRQ